MVEYVCPNCGAKYYSAASLEDMNNPYCVCGTKIEEETEDGR